MADLRQKRLITLNNLILLSISLKLAVFLNICLFYAQGAKAPEQKNYILSPFSLLSKDLDPEILLSQGAGK